MNARTLFKSRPPIAPATAPSLIGTDDIEMEEPVAAGRGAELSVFVHLAYDKDVEAWRRAHEAGRLAGFNDETPYGYGRAATMGCRLTFSRSQPETWSQRLLRLGLRAVLGFDLAHAWRNRHRIAAADVVWTHTESQYLAVAMLVGSLSHRPKIIGQTVWLMDRWRRLGPLYRAFYRRLMRRIDVLTFHSTENLALARSILPAADTRLLRYGIPSERMMAPSARTSRPIRVLAIGNDRDRDWTTLVKAVRGDPDISVLILSGTVQRRIRRRSQITVRRADSNEDLLQALAEATLVCVPLKLNRHASGITVIQEAVLAGVPVVASETGGLTDYFPSDEIHYVPVGDAHALRRAIHDVAVDPEHALVRSIRAQRRMARGELGANAYIRSHVDLSREVLGR